MRAWSTKKGVDVSLRMEGTQGEARLRQATLGWVPCHPSPFCLLLCTKTYGMTRTAPIDAMQRGAGGIADEGLGQELMVGNSVLCGVFSHDKRPS